MVGFTRDHLHVTPTLLNDCYTTSGKRGQRHGTLCVLRIRRCLSLTRLRRCLSQSNCAAVPPLTFDRLNCTTLPSHEIIPSELGAGGPEEGERSCAASGRRRELESAVWRAVGREFGDVAWGPEREHDPYFGPGGIDRQIRIQWSVASLYADYRQLPSRAASIAQCGTWKFEPYPVFLPPFNDPWY